jgi:hypothetical protein
VTLLAFWISVGLALGVGRSPSTIRYVYPGVILVLLIGAEALRGIRISPPALAIIFAATVFALGINLYRLDKGSAFFRGYSGIERAKLSAIELAANRVHPGFAATGLFAPVPAGTYLAAVARNGFTPAFTPAELVAQSEGRREIADSTLVGALRVELVPSRATSRPSGCRRIASVEGTSRFSARPPGVVLRSSATETVTVGQLAGVPTVGLGTVQPNAPACLRIPGDASDAPWKVAVSDGAAPVAVCRPPG